MRKYFAKFVGVLALAGAIFGVSVGGGEARVEPVGKHIVPDISEKSPLYLDQAKSLVEHKQLDLLAGHQSHYSHSSHQSHQSHYSHRSGY